MSYANLDAYTEGQQAKQDGQPVQSNPWPPYQPYHDDWLEGWHSIASPTEQNRNNRHEKIDSNTSAKLDYLLDPLSTDLQDALRELYAAQTKLEIINAANWARVLLQQDVKKLSHAPRVVGVDMAPGRDKHLVSIRTGKIVA